MNKVSRRSLASYGADQLLAGKRAAEIAKELAAQLVESGHAGEAEFLLSDIAWELEQRRELSFGQVTTAHPLSKELASALKSQLKKATQSKEILLEERVDKDLLGGIKVETAGRVWDMSVRRKLADLKQAL